MNIFLFSCSSHEPIIYRASGVKLILCGHGKGRRDLPAEYSMRITVGYGDPARGQVRKLLRLRRLLRIMPPAPQPCLLSQTKHNLSRVLAGY